jgi:glyoxylase-like metal-dependent hydrolase (beta-lactamase superfamily II)
MSSPLRADVYLAPPIPVTSPPLPFLLPAVWSPTTATLISGAREAILVDALLTNAQASSLADWITATLPAHTLTTIYITHGHGDHFLGLSVLLSRFPTARAVSTPKVIAHMNQQMDPAIFSTYWASRFPGQVTSPGSVTSPLPPSNTITLEGHTLRAYDAGHADTYDCSFLHVPALNMVVAGDIVYNEVHQYLGESMKADRGAGWIACLEQIAALKPETVIAGHKREGAVDGYNNIAATRAYIEAFREELEGAEDAEGLYRGMMKRYPHRVNPMILWRGCVMCFPQS